MATDSIQSCLARILYGIGDLYISLIDKLSAWMRVPLREERKRLNQWREDECRRVQYWKEYQHFKEKLVEETEKVEQWWKESSSRRCSSPGSGLPLSDPPSQWAAPPGSAVVNERKWFASGRHDASSSPAYSCSASSATVRRAPPASGYYAVAIGRNPGIYDSWKDANDQVCGYRFATFQGGFRSWAEVEEWRVQQIEALRGEGLTW